MNRISYPTEKHKVKEFEEIYLSLLPTVHLDFELKKIFRRRRALHPFLLIDIKDVLLYPIDKLIALSTDLNNELTPQEFDVVKLICNYDNSDTSISSTCSTKISNFFKTNLIISTCFFCNIDYINSFSPINDYFNWQDFFRRASLEEFEMIKGVKKPSAIKILRGRDLGLSIDKVKITKPQRENIKNLNIRDNVSLFTLDHFLEKANHPIAALSLYNFVPSCYNCNSKLKGSKSLINNLNDHYNSPTSSSFCFSGSVRFKLFFNNKNDTFLNVNSIEDFVLDFDVSRDKLGYENYSNIFKLRPRYREHKHEVVKLISKRKKYSHSRLEEISELTKTSIESIYKDIFGAELYDPEYDLVTLVKLKRDIAIDIGLQNVRNS